MRALNWALRDPLVQTTVFDTARSVLVVLADHANAADEAWPTLDTLARESGFRPTAVKNGLKELVDLGAIENSGYRDRCRVRRLRLAEYGDELAARRLRRGASRRSA